MTKEFIFDIPVCLPASQQRRGNHKHFIIHDGKIIPFSHDAGYPLLLLAESVVKSNVISLVVFPWGENEIVAVVTGTNRFCIFPKKVLPFNVARLALSCESNVVYSAVEDIQFPAGIEVISIDRNDIRLPQVIKPNRTWKAMSILLVCMIIGGFSGYKIKNLSLEKSNRLDTEIKNATISMSSIQQENKALEDRLKKILPTLEVEKIGNDLPESMPAGVFLLTGESILRKPSSSIKVKNGQLQ